MLSDSFLPPRHARSNVSPFSVWPTEPEHSGARQDWRLLQYFLQSTAVRDKPAAFPLSDSDASYPYRSKVTAGFAGMLMLVALVFEGSLRVFFSNLLY